MIHRLFQLFRPAQPVPEEFRSNFRQLTWDITWFGLLNGSAISFISVYAARLGADGLQIGLLTAAPAIVILLLALPAGSWLQSRRLSKSVVWAAAVNRSFYLLWAVLPWFFPPDLEIWAIIMAILAMTVPATVVSVGFNALFAEAVPPEWRGHVMGIRNAAFALTSTLTTIVCGWLLDTITFPGGYQVVFVIGFIGGVMSCFFLSRVKPIPSEAKACAPNHCPTPGGNPPEKIDQDCPKRQPYVQLVSQRLRLGVFRFDILHGSYGRIVGLLFCFHLAQYLAIPVIPLFLVNHLSLTDPEIGIGNATFYAFVFLGSTQLGKFSAKWGHKAVTGFGILLLGLYPGLLALSHGINLFIVASIAGGFAWSMAGGALFNYLLEKVPVDDRPPYLAWYNLGLNAAILIGSLAGPALAVQVGLAEALIFFAVLRLFAGLAILRMG